MLFDSSVHPVTRFRIVSAVKHDHGSFNSFPYIKNLDKKPAEDLKST